MTRVSELRNLGAAMEAALAEVGIASGEALDDVGPEEAYRRLKARRPSRFNVVALWAMEGALLELPWNDLPPGRARELRAIADRIAAAVSPAGPPSGASAGAGGSGASRR